MNANKVNSGIDAKRYRNIKVGVRLGGNRSASSHYDNNNIIVVELIQHS